MANTCKTRISITAFGILAIASSLLCGFCWKLIPKMLAQAMLFVLYVLDDAPESTEFLYVAVAGIALFASLGLLAWFGMRFRHAVAK